MFLPTDERLDPLVRYLTPRLTRATSRQLVGMVGDAFETPHMLTKALTADPRFISHKSGERWWSLNRAYFEQPTQRVQLHEMIDLPTGPASVEINAQVGPPSDQLKTRIALSFGIGMNDLEGAISSSGIVIRAQGTWERTGLADAFEKAAQMLRSLP